MPKLYQIFIFPLAATPTFTMKNGPRPPFEESIKCRNAPSASSSPDAVATGYTGAILAEIEKAGFKIVAIKKASISVTQAKGFYHVHAQRPFFKATSRHSCRQGLCF